MKKLFDHIKNSLSLWILLVASLTEYDSISAQHQPSLDLDTSAIYQVKLKDESSFIGRFIESKDSIFIFSSYTLIKIEVLQSQILSLKQIEESDVKFGKYWFPNPHYSRYFFGPSAFSLKKDQGYYQNIYGVFNSVNFGISDHFTLGGGTEIISLLRGYPILAVTPKFGNYTIGHRLLAGGGALLAVTEDGLFGIGYGIITKGTENKNITIGLGWAFSSEGNLETKPVLTVSGMARLSRSISFVSENWLIPIDGYEPIFSYGLRFFGEKMAVDVAFINSIELAKEISILGVPYIDFVYQF